MDRHPFQKLSINQFISKIIVMHQSFSISINININMQGYLVITNRHQRAFYLSLLTDIAINQYVYLLTAIDRDIDIYLYQDLLLSVCKQTYWYQYEFWYQYFEYQYALIGIYIFHWHLFSSIPISMHWYLSISKGSNTYWYW